jgi:Domain of unknown function (DUF5666)
MIRFNILPLFLGISLLAACNTTTNPTQPTTPTTGAVALNGMVGGTSAAPTMNGASLDLAGATVTENGDVSSTEAVQPGVEIEGNGEHKGGKIKIRTIELRYRAKGPIDTLDVAGSTLEVLGLKVTVNANTRISEKQAEGKYTTLALSDLKADDLVKVSGLPQEDDSIIATRIERRVVAAPVPAPTPTAGSEKHAPPVSDPNAVELFVRARDLDATGKLFTYGLKTHSVDYTKAEVRGKIVNDGFVRVRGVRTPVPVAPAAINVTRVINASRVVGFEAPNNAPGTNVELRGMVADLNETAKTFTMLGFTVDYATAQVKGTLANGSVAQVEGSLDEKDVKLVHAREVKLKKADAPEEPENH